MKYKKRKLAFLLLLALSLGGCSLFINQSAQRREMLDIAESQKMKVVVENMLKKLDPKALTPEGKIKTYKISKSDLDYNPMGGLMIKIITVSYTHLTLPTILLV